MKNITTLTAIEPRDMVDLKVGRATILLNFSRIDASSRRIFSILGEASTRWAVRDIVNELGPLSWNTIRFLPLPKYQTRRKNRNAVK